MLPDKTASEPDPEREFEFMVDGEAHIFIRDSLFIQHLTPTTPGDISIGTCTTGKFEVSFGAIRTLPLHTDHQRKQKKKAKIFEFYQISPLFLFKE